MKHRKPHVYFFLRSWASSRSAAQGSSPSPCPFPGAPVSSRSRSAPHAWQQWLVWWLTAHRCATSHVGWSLAPGRLEKWCWPPRHFQKPGELWGWGTLCLKEPYLFVVGRASSSNRQPVKQKFLQLSQYKRPLANSEDIYSLGFAAVHSHQYISMSCRQEMEAQEIWVFALNVSVTCGIAGATAERYSFCFPYSRLFPFCFMRV